MDSRLELTLLENSRSFLVEALNKALEAETDARQWKFAIFHMCQAIEISLKERLQREHPALIFENVDKGMRTVTSQRAINRLGKHCGVVISADDVGVIESATLWRNQIVHADCSLKVVELKTAFSVLLGFLTTFHKVVLAESLADHVPEDLWNEALQVQEYGDELFKRASRRMREERVLPEQVIRCPRCGRHSCVLSEDLRHCYVCGAEELLLECESCNQLVPESRMETAWVGVSDDEGWKTYICRRCVDAGEDMYIQQAIDWARGK